MSAAQLQDVPPNDETEAMAWVIDKYIGVCEWESVVTCFSEYAATIASGNPLTYISCTHSALVAIINCQSSRCAISRICIFDSSFINNFIASLAFPSLSLQSIPESRCVTCDHVRVLCRQWRSSRARRGAVRLTAIIEQITRHNNCTNCD